MTILATIVEILRGPMALTHLDTDQLADAIEALMADRDAYATAARERCQERNEARAESARLLALLAAPESCQIRAVDGSCDGCALLAICRPEVQR